MQPTIQLRCRIDAPDRVSLIALSPDGNRIAIACGKTLVVCRTSDGSQVARWECRAVVTGVSMSGNGELVAVALGHPVIDVYDVHSKKVISRLDRAGAPDFLRTDAQQHLAFYPNGTKLVSLGMKRRMYVSDVKTGKWDHIMFVKYNGQFDCAVSSDGENVVLFGKQNRGELSGHVTMYKVNHGLQPLWTKWHEGDGEVRHVAFSPSGRYVASCGAGDGVRVWDVRAGKPVQHIKSQTQPNGIAIPDDKHVVVGTSTELNVIHVESEETLTNQSLALPSREFAAAAGGSVFATYPGEATVDLWSISSKSAQSDSETMP